jgi:riboflavin synthase
MFTGIVQAKGRVQELVRNPFGVRLVIDRHGWAPPPGAVTHGASISVSGVCLTVVQFDDRTVAFDVIAETLAKSSLGGLRPGSEVNLESSLTASSLVAGHFVQGHVDGVGAVTRVKSTPEEWRLTVAPPAALMEYVIPKGSVSIDGVSLTIAEVGRSDFEVALIPTTLQITTLGSSAVGQSVNLEMDIISKTIVHWLRQQTPARGPLTLETLRHAGFVEAGQA